MITLAFDPGVQQIGVALLEHDALKYAALWRMSARGAAAAIRMEAALLEKWLHPGAPVRVLIETPQVYGRRGAGDPNDLIALAVVVGRLAQVFEARPVELVKPHAWKGSVPAEVMIRRVESRLTVYERSLVDDIKPKSLRHNVVDAVGLGLWKLGRLGR